MKSGFTLIELLVVITIAGLSMSLVGPLMTSQVDKMEQLSEFKHAENYIKNSHKVAFLKGQNLILELDGKRIQRHIGQDVQTVDYEHLFFPKQQYSVNSNGFSVQQQVDVIAGQQHKTISLADYKQ